MKINIKHIGFCTLLGASTLTISSCNDLLDLDPVSQITPESYYSTADQLGNYLNKYYDDFLKHPYKIDMYHPANWTDGVAQSDRNTDIMVQGMEGNTKYFATDHWEVPAGKNLQDDFFAKFRICNYFLETALPKYEAGGISGEESLIKNYIGEAYFFRALSYFKALVEFGDFPIITTVLPNEKEVLLEASKRVPRNEVARFIIEDLETAYGYLAGRELFNGQRVNKETALLLLSRVALFEGTFEKYHRGSGRVPGDANWPGAKMSYNSGKTFDIDNEVKFFFNKAATAAQQVADATTLTSNSHQMNPVPGVIYGWNSYFEMFGQPSLASVPEVLLWKQYDRALDVKHSAPYRTKIGSTDGYTRTFTESFLMKDGKPIYASSDYKGDVILDDVKAGRDERLQLFVWGESNLYDSDPASPTYGKLFIENGDSGVAIIDIATERRCISGYQPRKYYSYDYDQTANDEVRGTTACPIFRSAEAMLNYIEASYESKGTLDATARKYWQALRERAGVSTDIDATIAVTDLTKEGDFGVYSGTTMVDKTLYNIRRERMNELFSEGMRFADLVRWRSFDRLITQKWIPEGVNFWTELYKRYGKFTADGSGESVASSKELSKYIRPYSRTMSATNELKDGYQWHEAYYLSPIGADDMRLASPTDKAADSYLYQNLYWGTEGGTHAQK